MRGIRLECVALLLLFGSPSVPYAAGQAQMSCQLSSNVAYRGDTVTMTVFLDNASNVQAYQTRINITRTSGTGTLSVNCPGGVAINETRSDYLFFGLPNTSPSTVCALRSATSSLASGGASTGANSAYLSQYALTLSADAASNSTFEVAIQPAPASALVDSLGADIPFTQGLPCVLTVLPPALSLETTSCSECVRAPGSVAVALKVKSLDAPINGVQALFQYDPMVLLLTSVTPGDGQGSPWDVANVVGTQDNAGSAATALVLNGGQTSADSTVAILHFTTQSTGATAVGFRPDSPPFATKLTRASDNGTILPGVINLGGVIVGTRSKGDVNGDGLRNGEDIQPFLQALISPNSVPGDQACAADMNGDGMVLVNPDVALIVECLLTGNCVCP